MSLGAFEPRAAIDAEHLVAGVVQLDGDRAREASGDSGDEHFHGRALVSLMALGAGGDERGDALLDRIDVRFDGRVLVGGRAVQAASARRTGCAAARGAARGSSHGVTGM